MGSLLFLVSTLRDEETLFMLVGLLTFMGALSVYFWWEWLGDIEVMNTSTKKFFFLSL